MAIKVTLYDVLDASPAEADLAQRAAAALAAALNHPDFAGLVAAAPYSGTWFSDGRRSWSVPPAEVYAFIASGAERGTGKDEEVDLAVRLDSMPAGVIGSTTPGVLPFRTARWFILGCIEERDLVSPACHFIHEWLHVAGFYHQPDNRARGDVAYLVGDIVADLLRREGYHQSARMARLLEDAGCGAAGPVKG